MWTVIKLIIFTPPDQMRNNGTYWNNAMEVKHIVMYRKKILRTE